jgi:hypothetical protein
MKVTLERGRPGTGGATDPLRSRPQRHPELMRLLIGRTDGLFQFASDHRCFCFLTRKALEHPNVVFRPRAELQGLLSHFRPLAILSIAANQQAILMQDILILKNQTHRNQFSGACNGRKMRRTVLFLATMRYFCELDCGHSELVFETSNGALQIVTSHDRRLSEGRIAEMGQVTDTCRVLFGLDLMLKCGRHVI